MIRILIGNQGRNRISGWGGREGANPIAVGVMSFGPFFLKSTIQYPAGNQNYVNWVFGIQRDIRPDIRCLAGYQNLVTDRTVICQMQRYLLFLGHLFNNPPGGVP